MDIVKESLFKAAGFTALMLVLGVLVGLQMDDFRQDHLSEELRQSNLETETFVALQDYIEDSDNYCDLMEVRVPKISQRNSEFGSELTRLEGQSLGDKSEYEYIRNRYYNNQLQLYSNLNNYKSSCNVNQTTVLFFFDDSVDSQRQGEVLNEIVQKREDIHVFSLNSELNDDPNVADSPVVEVLKADYNITESPTMIINGEQKVEGYTSTGELENEVFQ
ncbi:hypothetical protein GLU60_03600 [Nanohaloarchaea archaeon H01]|jgi:hypothetical protein|nr:hypothetical protein [Nanohaloarchaea archaeon H01]